jgi:enoyl-[acyl-carrier protein] reductase/trans-2-enoyl-CoA reductase (NAD+)
MVIKPMIRNNVCMNAHPEGCRRYVQDQIDYVKSKGTVAGPKNALIIGASAGYGLATRIATAFGANAGTLGIAFEKAPSGKRTGSAGWYNVQAFEAAAQAEGITAETLIADAFSHETRQNAIERIQELFGTVDLVVYSVASGVRIDPDDGTQYRSVLRPIGNAYESKTVDPLSGEVSNVTIDPASDQEIEATVKVMGGEDWQLWINALADAGVLADGATTVAYSYIGPELTRPVYREGTIGKAKEHLEGTASTLETRMQQLGGHAYVSVNKALVTRASAVIPVVPLYLAILFRVMKDQGTHEGPIEQMHRLLTDRLYSGNGVPLDDEGRIRLDDWELQESVQKPVHDLWPQITNENVENETDLDGYRQDFLHIHGFGYDDIDYEKDIEP